MSVPPLIWITGQPIPLTPGSFKEFVRRIVVRAEKSRGPRRACPDAVGRLLGEGTSHPGFASLMRDATVWDRSGVITARPFHADLAGIDSPTGELLAMVEAAGGRIYYRLSRSAEWPERGLLVLSPRPTRRRENRANR
jgi:hypothetical protein